MNSAPSPTRDDVLLEAVGITKAFPGVRALDGVSITVHRGRLNALLGENGAGKSTLMNILAGVLSPDDGKVLLEGKPVAFRNAREAQTAGISIIFQELNLIRELSIAENIFIGREPLTRFGLLDIARMNSDAAALLRELELDVAPSTPISQLPVGSQQVVEIAKAISFNARVLIMDEPTSAITEHEKEMLFRQILRLKRSGVGIIYITHKLDELAEISDDVTVFRDGRLVGSKRFSEVSRDDLIRMIVGRELSDLFPKTPVKLGADVLHVRDLSLTLRERPGAFALRDISLHVRSGEVLGIFGLMGAGRTKLLQTIFGMYPDDCMGEIEIDGQSVRIASPHVAIKAGLALAPEDRKADGLVLDLSVAHNMTLSCLSRIERMGLLNRRAEAELVSEYVKSLGVKTPSIDQPVINLSGGNQQKVVLAKWLATGPKVLLLDEPTRGIDINAKREIYSLIDRLAQSGLGVVMVSSELPELLGISDRIIVLCKGRKTAEFSRIEATEEKLVRAALPVSSN